MSLSTGFGSVLMVSQFNPCQLTAVEVFALQIFRLKYWRCYWQSGTKQGVPAIFGRMLNYYQRNLVIYMGRY
jgi:hypothetical protein